MATVEPEPEAKVPLEKLTLFQYYLNGGPFDFGGPKLAEWCVRRLKGEEDTE